MTWAREKATDLLRQGGERLEAGQSAVAIATLCRAFDVLDREDERSDPLRLSIVELLEKVQSSVADPAPLIERAAALSPQLMRKAHFAGSMLQRALAMPSQDPKVLEFFLRYLESRGPLDKKTRDALFERLSVALGVRAEDKPEDVEHLIPALERLHACRPNLAFPRLFLGRYFFGQGSYDKAEAVLSGIKGRLALRPKVLNLRGRCFERLERKEEAKEAFRQSLEQKDDQPDIHFRLGRLIMERLPLS